MRTPVAAELLKALYAYGIRYAYGIHGANSEDLFAAALRAPAGNAPTVTVAKHEFAAGAMADGAARVTGRPACVITTSGGGALNCVPALAEAHDTRVPVLALIGCAPTLTEGRGGFQSMCTPPRTIDAPAVFAAVTGFAARVAAPEDLPAALDGALDCLDRGLPAALLLPKDVQTAGAPALAVRTAAAPVGDAAPSAAVVDALRSAQRPLILLGERASRAALAGPVAALATRSGAVVALTPNARDASPPGVPVVGVTGVMGHPAAADAAAAADLILALGTDLSVMDRAGLDEALDRTFTVHVDAAPPLRPVTIHQRVAGLTAYTDALTRSVGDRQRPPWTAADPRPVHPEQPDGIGLTCAEAVTALAGAIPPEALVFADAGNCGAAVVHRLPLGTGGRFVVALGMGGMGWGIAGGIGAAVATGRRTVIIAGDGAFLMHGLELHTAIETGAPVLLVILNNDAHGMCVTRDAAFFPDVPTVNRFRHTAIGEGLAAMFPGLPVRTAGTVGAVTAAARAILADTAPPGPAVLVIDTDPAEVPPFASLLPRPATKEPA